MRIDEIRIGDVFKHCGRELEVLAHPRWLEGSGWRCSVYHKTGQYMGEISDYYFGNMELTVGNSVELFSRAPEGEKMKRMKQKFSMTRLKFI